MIYLTISGRAVDTDMELTSPQRHVLQKLLTWEHLGLKPEDYAVRRGQALQQGWGSLGPVEETAAFKAVADDLGIRLFMRHGHRPGPGWLKLQVWPGRYAGGGLEPGQVQAQRVELVVRDAADLERGRLWRELLPGENGEQALARHITEDSGLQALLKDLRALGLDPRS